MNQGHRIDPKNAARNPYRNGDMMEEFPTFQKEKDPDAKSEIGNIEVVYYNLNRSHLNAGVRSTVMVNYDENEDGSRIQNADISRMSRGRDQTPNQERFADAKTQVK